MGIVLGWWIIPVVISLFWLMITVIKLNKPKGHFLDLTGLGELLMVIPVMIIWLIYCVFNIWFGIL